MNWPICLLIFVLAGGGSSLTGANGGTPVANWGLVVSEPVILCRWSGVRCHVGSSITVRTARDISRGCAAFAGQLPAWPVVENFQREITINDSASGLSKIRIERRQW
jgi:hypothetical protein